MLIQDRHHVFRSSRCKLLRVEFGLFGQSDQPYRINDRKALGMSLDHADNLDSSVEEIVLESASKTMSM